MAMYSRVETITPDIAADYLTKNKVNRSLKLHAIRNYARDMANGDWQLSPQGISFYENGNLADGQNRLHAVIRAGVPVDFYVTYGVPNESTIQDRGVSRSTTDVFKMGGKSNPATSTAGIAIVNTLFIMANLPHISDSIRVSFVNENEATLANAVRFTQNGGKNVVGRKAAVGAAVFCALYSGVDSNAIENFCQVLNTGFQNDFQESAAIVVRNFITKEYTGNTNGSKWELFHMTLNAIKDFSRRNPRRIRYKVDSIPPYWEYVKKQTIEKYADSYNKK